MSSVGPLAIFVAVVGILVAVHALERRLVSGSATASQSFWCPFRQRNVQAVFAESAWDGRFDVKACDAFTPPTEVGCDKACLDLKRLPHAKAQPPEPPPRSWVW